MPIRTYKKERNTAHKKIANSLSYITLIGGALLLFWAFYPIVSFEIYSKVFLQRKISSSLLNQTDSPSVYSNNLRDFTQASLWFPAKPQALKSKPSIKEYSVAIPKLNIDEAQVLVGGDDLSKSLIHYLPETMPGENGNVIIFGHSTLPQLYNVNNYKTIFTYLPSLEKGDSIQVKVGETVYEYAVTDMFVVKPDQVSVLEQKKDGSYLTLITCVPPGTYWNRLVV
ncbi:MAG: sortase, partial [Patescibacteria group bacterium]